MVSLDFRLTIRYACITAKAHNADGRTVVDVGNKYIDKYATIIRGVTIELKHKYTYPKRFKSFFLQQELKLCF